MELLGTVFDLIDIDADAGRLIRELQASGVRVRLASPGRDASMLLGRGLADLPNVATDGTLVNQTAALSEYPPPLFLDCLMVLGDLPPSSATVFTDATAAVGAGRSAGFGLVVGVDRGGEWVPMREHGADWIVRGFAGISGDMVLEHFRAREYARPNALAVWPELSDTLKGRQLALFLDYDGTLTPIVEHPELAVLSEEMRATLRRVSAVWPTTIVSGRGLEDVAAMTSVDTLTYAGSHGFDVAGPPESGLRLQVEPRIVPTVQDAARTLRERTAHLPGIVVEDKRFSVAVHYRLAPDRAAEVGSIVDEVLATEPQLRKMPGKMVLELRPAREWDKGRAVQWLLDRTGLNRPDVVPLFIGDDTTDEDAFRAIGDRGIGIAVMDPPRPTAASHSLQNVEEIRLLLDRLSALGTTSAT